MLTQRIGKSANEFLTGEGVNPRSRLLARQGLNSSGDITKGLLDGNAQMGLPGTPPTRNFASGLAGLLKQYQETAHARQRHPRQPSRLECRAGSPEHHHLRQRPLRKGLEVVQERLSTETSFGGITALMLVLSAVLVAIGGYGFVRLYVTEQRQLASMAQTRRAEAEGQEQGGQNASTTPTRRRSCG